MTAGEDPPRMALGAATARTAPAQAAAGELAAWNRALNRTHAMAGLRARGGRVVRAIEARRRRLLAAAVTAGRHRLVLDVGAEDGWLAAGYAERTERLVLLDLDPDVLAGAALAEAPGVETRVADATDATSLGRALGEARFDVVVVSALLEHLPRPDDALRALTPRLAPGGRLVVYVPADGPILLLKAILRRTGFGRLVRGLPLEPAPGHLHRFDRRSLARLLAPHGRILSLVFDPLVLGYLALLARGPGAD